MTSLTRCKWNRRDFLAGTVAIGLSTVLGAQFAGCGPAPAPTPTPAPAPKPAEKPAAEAKPTVAAPAAAAKGEPVAIKMSVWGSPADKDVYDAITQDFNKAQDKIVATPEQWVGDYYAKMQVQLAANMAPDILYYEPAAWQPYAFKRVLQPLDSFRARDKWDKAWPDIPMIRDYCYLRGKLYMVASESNTVAMLYSKDVFDKAGVAYPKNDWTVQDYIAIAQKLTNPKEKVFGASPQMHFVILLGLWRTEGALEWEQIVEPKQSKWNDPVIAEAFQLHVTDAVNKLKITPTPTDLQGGATTIWMGNVGMMYTGSFYVPFMQGPQAKREGGVKFEVALSPRGRSGKPVNLASLFGHTMNAAGKNQDATWELLKWISSDEGQKRISIGGRQCGTPEMTTKYWVEQANKRFNFTTAKVFVDAYDYGQASVIGSITQGEVQDKGLKPAMDKMVNGTPAKDALAECHATIQQLLDDFWAKQK